MQNLGRAMRRINIMGMHRSKIAGEFVQCVVTDEGSGWRAQYTVLGVKLLNCDPSAGGITFTERLSSAFIALTSAPTDGGTAF